MSRSILLSAFLLGSTLACSPALEEAVEPSAEPAEPLRRIDLAERRIEEAIADAPVPGIAAAIVKNGEIVWAKGFGLADLEAEKAMTPETIINVASISKTVVNAAVLQLVEEGRLDLDAAVDRYLPFGVRHPDHPQALITARRLLTHTAAISDGPAYKESYACGDPAVSLVDWIEGYFVPDGAYYDAENNFERFAPGARYSYSNLGFGLLALLVEQIEGESFTAVARRRIFAPLGMESTAWHLADVNLGRHAVPYAHFRAGTRRDRALLAGIEPGSVQEEDGFVPYCLYSFYNYPDGLLRTSVRQLARFLSAHLEDGAPRDQRLLAASTLAMIFSAQAERERLGKAGIQGLTWYAREAGDGELTWGHSGGDPGVATLMLGRPADRTGAIVVANRGIALGPLAESLLEAAREW